MPKWQNIELGNMIAGMSTNVVNAGQSTAKKLLNVQNHIKPGALILRPGYELRYGKPVSPIKNNAGDSVLADLGIIEFDFLFDRQADSNGVEVICLIQKAILYGLRGEDDFQNMLNFWIRPYWNGEEWIDEWQWLNQTILTKITNKSNEIYPNLITIEGGVDNGIEYNSLRNFVIYNRTKDQYAKIITAKNNISGTIEICHTLYNCNWEVGDTVIIGRNWIMPEYQNELFKTDWRDITFHKINNDLRIGFGGFENRPGISIGYRKNFYQIGKFDFPNKYSTLTEEGVLEYFSKTDEIVIDTHILNNNYGIMLNSGTGGDLAGGEYKVRLTGIIDGFEEQLLTEATIILDENSTLEILPFVNIALINPRITGYGVYLSQDLGITYYGIFRYNLKEKLYSAGVWKIDVNGRLILVKVLDNPEAEILELHNESNAISPADINISGSWTTYNGGNLEIVSNDAVDNYAFKYIPDQLVINDITKRTGIKFPLSSLTSGKSYTVSVYMKGTYEKLYGFFVGDSLKILGRTQTEVQVSGEYSKKEFQVVVDKISEEAKYFVIAANPFSINFLSIAGGVVYKSEDCISWIIATSGLPELDWTGYYIIINYGYSLLACSSLGSVIYKSTNHGSTWEALSTPNNVCVLSIVNNRVLAGCLNGDILESLTGETFATINNSNIDSQITAINNIAEIDTFLRVGTREAGVYKSYDNGVTFSAMNTGLLNLNIITMIFDTDYTYVGTNGKGIFRCRYNEETWTQTSTGIGNNFISAIIRKGEYLYAATFHDALESQTIEGVFRSEDGIIWVDVSSGLGSLDIYDLYVNGNDLYATCGDGKTYKSSGTGSDWVLAKDFGENNYAVFQEGLKNEFLIDKISIKEKNTVLVKSIDDISSVEMQTELGYVPTKDLVKGWDQVLTFNGRAYYLNPFVEKRYENYILVSHIHSSGAYQYDLASFSNYRELDKFESTEAVGMALLPTLDIIILADSAIAFISEDGTAGRMREPVYGVGCIAKKSIVNMNGLIFWCGGEDIFVLDLSGGFSPKALLKNTIRDLYLSLSDKSGIQCVRDKHNSLRVRTYKPIGKTEYIFSGENGWVEEVKENFPEIYKVGFRNKLYFLSLGDVYCEDIQLDYSAIESIVMTNEFVNEDFTEEYPDVEL